MAGSSGNVTHASQTIVVLSSCTRGMFSVWTKSRRSSADDWLVLLVVQVLDFCFSLFYPFVWQPQDTLVMGISKVVIGGVVIIID